MDIQTLPILILISNARKNYTENHREVAEYTEGCLLVNNKIPEYFMYKYTGLFSLCGSL